MIFFSVIIFIFYFDRAILYSFEDLDLNTYEHIYNKGNNILERPAIDDLNGDIYMPYLFNTGVGNRERLVINDISLDESFPYANNVMSWNTISIGGRQFLIGKQEHSVTMIHIKIKQYTTEKFNTLYFNETFLEFEGTIGPIVLTNYINYTTGLEEGLALVTESNIQEFQRIHWLKITNKGLKHYDTWSNPTRGEIIHLNWIKFNFMEFLLITTKEANNYTTIDISEYKLQDEKMRLMCLEKLRVDYIVSSVSTVVQGEDLYIVLVAPDLQKFRLYRYHLNFYQDGGFELKVDISSLGVTKASMFIQSGRNYFLTNGDQPNIYLLNQDGSLSSQLNDCGRVDEWLVVEVPNYREDVILVARDLEGVSLLTWSGSLKGFTLAKQPPCFEISSTMNKISKISDDAGCLSWCGPSGGAVVNLGHVPSLILVCNSNSDGEELSRIGGLYYFNVSLHPTQGQAGGVMQVLSRVEELDEKVTNLSKKYESEGLMEDVAASRRGLEEGWSGEWNGLERCLAEVEEYMNKLDFYMTQRRQNDIVVNISLHQGKIIGAATGFLGNQTVQTTFKGKLSSNGTYSNRIIDIESDVVIDNIHNFAVKAKMNMGNIKVTEITSDEDMKSSDGYGVSPEIQGQPQANKRQEKSLHQTAQEVYEEI